jgi:hypothetical protein
MGGGDEQMYYVKINCQRNDRPINTQKFIGGGAASHLDATLDWLDTHRRPPPQRLPTRSVSLRFYNVIVGKVTHFVTLPLHYHTFLTPPPPSSLHPASSSRSRHQSLVTA